MNTPPRTAYLDEACAACALERTKQYGEAAACWLRAADKARHPDNRQWAQARADFCLSRVASVTSSSHSHPFTSADALWGDCPHGWTSWQE